MPPDPRAARGRADAPRASPDETRASRHVGPAKHRSVRSTRETSFGSLVSLVCRALAVVASTRTHSRHPYSSSAHHSRRPSAVPANAGRPPGRARGDLHRARGARRRDSPARAAQERAGRHGARRGAEQKSRGLGARSERVFADKTEPVRRAVPPRRGRVQLAALDAARRGCQNLQRRRSRARGAAKRFDGDVARARVSPGGRAAEGGGGGGGSQPKDRHLESTRRPTRGGGERVQQNARSESRARGVRVRDARRDSARARRRRAARDRDRDGARGEGASGESGARRARGRGGAARSGRVREEPVAKRGGTKGERRKLRNVGTRNPRRVPPGPS